jgi:hypothetical protein
MQLQDYTEVVEKLLNQTTKEFPNSNERLAYERGYLTVVLARVMLENPNVANRVTDLIRRKSITT